MAPPSPERGSMRLLVDKHVEFISGFAKDRTTFEAVATDHLRLSGVYWGLAALALLGKLDCGGEGLDRDGVAAFVSACAHEAAEGVSSAAAPSATTPSPSSRRSVGYGGAERHDPHLLYTLSAVQVAALIDRMDLIDADAVMTYVASLQLPDGSFAGDKWGEVDTRFSFCALATAALLGRLDRLDVEAAARHVALRCHNDFDAGFGAQPGGESHAGQVFVCVAALAIAGRLDLLGGGGSGGGIGGRGGSGGSGGGIGRSGGIGGGGRNDSTASDDDGENESESESETNSNNISPRGRDSLSWWLCERQTRTGGLNGRPEKLPDVCYSWWCVSSLAVLGRLRWIDGASLARFVLEAQDENFGGIADRAEDAADVYHTFFGVAGLSLLRDGMEEEEEGGGEASGGGDEKEEKGENRKRFGSRLDATLGCDAGLEGIASIDPVFALPYDALERTAVGKAGWRGLCQQRKRRR